MKHLKNVGKEYSENIGHCEKTKYSHHGHKWKRRISDQCHKPEFQQDHGRKRIQTKNVDVYKKRKEQIDKTRHKNPHSIA